jgi:anion-transporting  ArsA/GET3 family ATPase
VLLDDLLARRLVILSGKGGVGKSVVGAALADAAHGRGKRVLLVEVDAPLETVRRRGAPAASGTETEIKPGLWTVNLRPAAVMEDYVRETVKVGLIARRILASPIYHRFFAAAPGLPELMTLGKIMVLEEARDRWSRQPRYDLVIVDAPATGHGLAFLKVPQAASAAVPVGPVGANARRIIALLKDAKRTALVLVAIPEEMAVVEAIEFHRMATEDVGIRAAAVVLNACHERRLTDAQEAEVRQLIALRAEGRLTRGVRLSGALAAARRHLRRRKLTRFYQARLKRALQLPVVSLPYLFDDELGPEAIGILAERLAEA